MEDACQNIKAMAKALNASPVIHIGKKDVLTNYVDITVTEAEKRMNGALNLREFFTVYLIESKVKDTNWLSTQKPGTIARLGSLWRRYTEFEMFRSYLEATYPFVVIPPLPEKRVLFAWQKVATDTFDPDFVDRRRAGLENFLLRVGSHPILSFDPQFIAFFQKEEGWRHTGKDSSYLQIAESKLKSLMATVHLKETDKRFEQIKNYSNELQNNMNNLLRVRARLAERLYNIHKLHSHYGRIFSEWSAVEKDMGDGLQKAGHYLDGVAASIDTPLEEEELLADQFKEYLFFSHELKAVCRRYEILQLQLEKAEEMVQQCTAEKEKAQQGKMGLMSRLLGSIDTDEVREIRVGRLEQRIEEHKDSVRNSEEQRNEFIKSALDDVNRFQQQKVEDLKETLGEYVTNQIEIARKGLQTWTHIRDCLESIK